MKRILFPALISATLIVPVIATTATTTPPAANPTTPVAAEHHEKHHRHHHGKMTAAEMKAECEKRMGELKGDSLTGDDKVLFDAKMDMMKTAVGHMDKFSTEKSGQRAAKKLHGMCMKTAHNMEHLLKRAEKNVAKEKKKAEKVEVKKEEPKKEEPKKNETKPAEKK